MNYKEQILNKALKLFALHGYDGITVNMICRKVGITKSVFTSNYSGKEELLDEILIRCNDILVKANPTIALRKELADTLTLQETLKFLIDKYIFIWNDPQDMLLWQVVSNEQYRNKEAGKIILEETSARIERLAVTFDLLQQNGKMIPCNSYQVATSYAYSIRAQHLDYLFSKLYLPENNDRYIEGMYQTGKAFADLYSKD